MLRGLKHLAGILLATFGVMFVIGSIANMLDREADIPLWMAVVFLVFLTAETGGNRGGLSALLFRRETAFRLH